MAKYKPNWVKIEQRLTAEPIHSGGRTIQAVAQMTGWQWRSGRQLADDGGVLVQIRPLEIIVHQAGEERTIPIFDPASSSLRTIVRFGLIVSIFCWAVMFVAQQFATRR